MKTTASTYTTATSRIFTKREIEEEIVRTATKLVKAKWYERKRIRKGLEYWVELLIGKENNGRTRFEDLTNELN